MEEDKKKSKPKSKKTVVKKSKKSVSKSTNVVEQKLNDMLSEQSDKTVKTKKKKTGKNIWKNFPWWPVLFITLLLIVLLLVLYQVSGTFKKNANALISSINGNTQQTKQIAQPKIFELPITIIYDKNSANQKELIDRYIQNLEFNLSNTKANVTMIDMHDPKGKALLKQINAKFVPQFITDKSVLNHPQYAKFSSALDQIGDLYVFKTEGLEYLTLPDAKDGVDIGAPLNKAKVTVMEYLSFSCEFCKKASPVVDKLVEKYKKNVAFVIKMFDRGGPDLLLAQSALCANEQGRFEKMSKALYSNQDKIFTALQNMKKNPRALEDELRTIARSAKVNSRRMFECINTNKYADIVKKQTKEGIDFGVIGTPTFFIGNEYIGGYINEAAMDQKIQNELAKKTN